MVVPAAAPSTPSGNWFTRSAKYISDTLPAGSSVPITVSTPRLSWVMPLPVSRGRGSPSGIPARDAAHISTPSCATPDAVMPQAAACATPPTYGVSSRMAAMPTTLNST